MLQIIGSICIMLGSVGVGYSLIQDIGTKRKMMVEFIRFFMMLQSEISYQRETIPDACGKIGKKMKGRLGRHFQEIPKQVEEGRLFLDCWREEMEQAFYGIKIDVSFKKHILEFPTYIGFHDGEMQYRAVALYMEDITKMKEELEGNMKDQVKIIQAISISCGIVITIILF